MFMRRLVFFKRTREPLNNINSGSYFTLNEILMYTRCIN